MLEQEPVVVQELGLELGQVAVQVQVLGLALALD
jgi:hypothetical protein